jgi:RNA polymerase sigma factor (TIGR02999 family)
MPVLPLATVRAQTTAFLRDTAPDDLGTVDHLVPLIYDELRAMAHRQLRSERAEHTLHTTALVHEAYLRLVEDKEVTSRGRAYFFAAAARATRQVLVDYARRHKALKRGGGARALDIEDQHHLSVAAYAEELIDLDEALSRLAELNPRQAHVVECHFFGGLTVEETANALGVSPRTVHYDWALARAWLYDALGGSDK